MEGEKSFNAPPVAEKQAEEKEMTIIRCAWCKKPIEEREEAMADGSKEGHGICKECKAEKDREIAEEKEKIAKMKGGWLDI